ncbi:Uma2 family endonuclease [Crocosphaera chwakensis]|uniref:Putative restriction endonuclease domain-containing protein n=1 Tax=Crocosphaera chwakensis CCY0110 TaxID=391612 RepID=A3IGX8_9CHRO|nr:Uma2 family endonuclease [Crocosphaera chwakensis]EAZ94220.1 hypothetical protein CY0110_10107 [Crocosphaera chwakensis CCY0110]
MITQIEKRHYSIEEYLELEKQADIRHEFINGNIIAMAGGTTNHNEIVTNLCLLLKPILRQQGGRVYTENVRLWISDFNVFTYPDVMVIASNPIYYTDSQTTVTNPVVIFEVLSESTRDYDQGRKFGFYRSINNLQEYILVDPETVSIMIYRRGKSKQWSLYILNEKTDNLTLNSLNLELSLNSIYEGVI